MSQISIEKAVAIALEQHKAGNFGRAERLYTEILRQDPGNVDAMHLLGVLARQGKDPEAAVRLITAAIRKKPDAPIFHYNLAEACNVLGQTVQAVAAYERAIELDPLFLAAYNNLSSLYNQLLRFEDSERLSRQALELEPDNAVALNNHGVALRGLKRSDEALIQFQTAVKMQPDLLAAVTNFALCLCYFKRVKEGIAQFHRAIELDPISADLHNNLGTAYIYDGQIEAAGQSFQRAIDLNPNHPQATNNLGSTLRSLGKVEEAVELFRKSIEFKPDFIESHLNLASALSELHLKSEALVAVDAALLLRPNQLQAIFLRGLILRDLSRIDEGIDTIRRVLVLDPTFVPALSALGYALQERGELDEAMTFLNDSIKLKPDAVTHSNVLLAMNYHPGFSPEELFVAHRSWAELHEQPHVANWQAHTNNREPNRKLRIGYVSPDFRGHSVTNFLAPVLDHHNHDRFEVYGYAHMANTDMSTWRLRAQIDVWRETSGRKTAEVAAQIREDQIDILIDLAGHTANNSLTVFALKPAPVQINMIGFPSTTGLCAMDYRITDALCDPPGESDGVNSETLIRLPDLFWAYEPPQGAPPIGPLPADGRNGQLTFASVNNFTKVTPQVQQLWAKLLLAVPKSRLILQTGALSSDYTRKVVTERFQAAGVPADRLEFRAATPFAEFLQFLSDECDATLDPFPFNGGTTTCHSLWMGVPVLTLAGNRHASLMGLSMMTAIGLPECIAHTPEEYVQMGERFANNLPRLRELRRTMRDRLNASPLLDGAGYTKNLEAAYREVWKKWCASNSTNGC